MIMSTVSAQQKHYYAETSLVTVHERLKRSTNWEHQLDGQKSKLKIYHPNSVVDFCYTIGITLSPFVKNSRERLIQGTTLFSEKLGLDELAREKFNCMLICRPTASDVSGGQWGGIFIGLHGEFVVAVLYCNNHSWK